MNYRKFLEIRADKRFGKPCNKGTLIAVYDDELINRLLFIEKLEIRIALSENGRESIPEDVLKNEIDKWSKK